MNNKKLTLWQKFCGVTLPPEPSEPPVNLPLTPEQQAKKLLTDLQKYADAGNQKMFYTIKSDLIPLVVNNALTIEQLNYPKDYLQKTQNKLDNTILTDLISRTKTTTINTTEYRQLWQEIIDFSKDKQIPLENFDLDQKKIDQIFCDFLLTKIKKLGVIQ